jgi:hypothetical protein
VLLLKRFVLCATLLAALAAGGSASAQTAAELWPLETGNAWTLELEDGAAAALRIEVTAERNGWAITDGPLGRVWLWASPRTGSVYAWDAVSGSLDRAFDLAADTFTMRLAGDACLDGSAWKIADRSATVDTPAGAFSDCVVIELEQAPCVNARVSRVAFAPNVGPVLWERRSAGATERYLLSRAAVGGRTWEPAPAGAITPFLPERFTTTGQGVGQTIDITAQRIVLVQRGLDLGPAPTPLERIASRFLALNTGRWLPAGVVPRLAIYDLTNPQGLKLWSGNGSLGQDTRTSVLATVEGLLPPAGTGCRSFEEKGALSDLVLGRRHSGDVGPAAVNLGALIAALTDDEPQSAPLARAWFQRGCREGEFGFRYTRAVFIDPTVRRSPEPHAYLVIWTDGYEE